MNTLEIQKIILKNTYTKSDYIRRVNILKTFLESRFFKDFKGDFSSYLEVNNVSQADRKAIGILDEHFFNLFTKDNFYPIINELAESVRSLPVLTIYLAIVIDNVFLEEIGDWFRKNLHPELLIEVHCNPNLVAGAAYVWNNQYRDLSLRHFFMKKEDLITRIIDSYGKQQL